MAIPSMMAEMGQQSANYGAAVGQSLIALGQQVGQQLATREYQRQAQAALPALQQTYSSALDKIESGNVTEGYRDILNAQLQFGATQNPFLARINEGAAKVAESAADAYMRKFQTQMQYGGRGGTTTGPMPGFSPEQFGMGATNQPMSPQGQQGTTGAKPMRGGPMVEPDTMPSGDEEYVGPDLGQGPAEIPEYSARAIENDAAVASQPLEQQAEAAKSYAVTDYDSEKFELVPVEGINKFIPGFLGFRVPKEEWQMKSARMLESGQVVPSSEFVAPHARKNFYEGPGGEKPSTQQGAKDAVEAMKDREMTDLFKQFNSDIYALRSATSESEYFGKKKYDVKTPNGKKVGISEGQYKAIRFLAGIVPAAAQGAGDTPAVFAQKQEDFSQYEGKVGTDKKTGKKYRIVNGKPVEIK